MPSRTQAEELYNGKFLALGENLIIFGPPVCGKGFFARLIASSNGKSHFTIICDRPGLAGDDLRNPILLSKDGIIIAPASEFPARLVECEVLILDGLANPVLAQSFCEQLSRLFKARAETGLSTIVLATVIDNTERNLLAERFPVTREGRKWHVLDFCKLTAD